MWTIRQGRRGGMKSARGLLQEAAILALLCASLTTFARAAFAQEGTFIPTGSMNTARDIQTATLLNNGMVLIAGGEGSSGSVASAELYDPVTGTFTPTGSMNIPRVRHTATLLNNGTVLITGGTDDNAGGIVLASAEVYDPAKGTFTPTGSMNSARESHTATLLKSGRVLVAGGVGFEASAEVYDPTTGTFTATGSMNTGRYAHTATLLNDGTVLVAGGIGPGGNLGSGVSLASAELFAPMAGTFTPSGSMSTARYIHTATLLSNGTVLVAGGGIANGSASAELYDPTAKTFNLTGSMNVLRFFHTATLLNNGRVLVAGGAADDGSGILASAELYDPTTMTFTLTGSMNTARDNHTATLLTNGTALVAGGNPPGGTLMLANAELYELVVVVPASLSFSNQMVGITSASQNVTLENNESAALNITNIGFSGANASDFEEVDNCLGNLAAGASCSINVTFTPAATGNRTGSLAITNNVSVSPLAVPLTGTGSPPAPIVSLSSTRVVFANQSFGTTSATQTVTLRNTGAAILNIQTVALAGANPGDFAVVNGSTCTNGTTVAANGSCVIQLTFTPTASGTRSATLGISDNAADSPETIGLSGTSAPISLVSVAPSSISFPAQYVGTSGLPQSVTVTNSGDAPLSITSVTVSPGDFGTLNACGSNLAAGASCAIGVFFDPTASGTRPGTLTIIDNAPGSPQTVTLSGTGQDFSLASSGQTTAIVAPGQTASYALTVTPGGGFNQTVTLSCSGAPAQSDCSISPGSFVLNGSATVTVAVHVTTMSASTPTTTPPTPNRYERLYLITELLVLSILIALVIRRDGRRPRFAFGLSLLLFLCVGVMMSGCGSGSSTRGGGGNLGTPVGNYMLTVSGTFASGSTSLTHNVNLNLVVQ
jgi:Galactose oxidase, central domain/Abnormal spindle-like microcephaly-assoc'd, ASPM-SPD-2-Hydin